MYHLLSDTVRLKQWILERYAASAFNTCCTQPLPSMHGDPLVIVTKPGTTPSAIHVPAPVPIHYQTEVKKGLDRDVALGVLEKVPVNTLVEWLHRMVIAVTGDLVLPRFDCCACTLYCVLYVCVCIVNGSLNER